MHSSITIANCFLDLAEQDSESLTPMKIQKLVYIAHGWHLGLNEKPLVSEQVEAWNWGPVFPKLYHTFKHYGRKAITHKATDRNRFGISSSKVSDETWDFLDAVWDEYHKYTGIQLAKLTHEPASPWDAVTRPYREGKGNYIPLPRNLPIEDQIIKGYYDKLIEKNIQDETAE